MSNLQRFFAEDGELAQAVGGYRLRKAQLELAIGVQESLDCKGILVAEAGTGTGKTFAYLAPIFMSDGKTVISTGTKNLQEQLFNKDIPLVKNLISKTKKVALLKGRSNYLCIHRLGLNGGEHIRIDKQTLAEYQQIKRWSLNTVNGDLGEVADLSENASVIPLVTSTVDNCLGKDCKDYNDCYLIKARQKALSAEVVVVNHHLFFADLALKEEGVGELIPNANAIVFDEAHLLPDIASEYFGQSLSTRQLTNLLADIQKIQKSNLKDASQMSAMAEKALLALLDLRLCFDVEPKREELTPIFERAEFSSHLKKVKDTLNQVLQLESIHHGRDVELDKYFERLATLESRLLAVTEFSKKQASYWYETTKRHIKFNLTPLDISSKFAEIVEDSEASWIFTSATLSVNGEFAHYQRSMGLDNAKTMQLGSPFDYQNKSLLCVPKHLPLPNDKNIKKHLISIALSLISASKGSAFFLFTSHYMMRQVAEEVSKKTSYKVIVQGDASKSVLLARFLAQSGTVLFATGAFWEGVDVKGSALQCVMIDKLPFVPPDDPLLKARLKLCSSNGGKPFYEVQIPQAVISLKQGAGRLIRDYDDKGVLIICDNRLVNKPYGKIFLNSLPDMRRTRDLRKVENFLNEISNSNE